MDPLATATAQVLACSGQGEHVLMSLSLATAVEGCTTMTPILKGTIFYPPKIVTMWHVESAAFVDHMPLA